MKWSAALWVIVPGVGQIHLGRTGKGILLFTLFVLMLNAYLLSPLLLPDKVIRTTLLALTMLAWLISTVDYFRQSTEEEMANTSPDREPLRDRDIQ
ncbi:MAG: hypothetical protein HYY16_12300 [Planctomycetes bacterium]|nr:hypothetical protein [Planctomycetota bacterium]